MSEAQERATSAEFEQWRIFNRIEPGGDELLTLLMVMLRSAWAETKQPDWWKQKRQQTEEEMLAALKGRYGG